MVLATLAIGILVPVLWREEPIEIPEVPPTPPPVAVPEENESSLWRLEELEAERVVDGSVRRTVRALGWRDGLAFAASFVLLTLALRWWQLPEASHRHRQRLLDEDARRRVERRQEERRRGYAERAEMARELLEAGRSPLVPFQVPELPAVSLRAVDDAAVVLARLQEEIPGRDDLDAEATVAATVEAGGRAVPVYEQGRLQATLLVLVDDEGGDHPWLGGFQRVLDRWQRRGVRMLRFTFCEQPDPVWPYPRGAAVSFDVLSRRHAGLPLVIFSRRLTHRGVTAAGADWTRRLEVWPVKAWIDPDPTPFDEAVRRPGFDQDVRGLKRLGFARFGLDRQDLPMLARYLVEAGTGIAPPSRRPLPGITPELEPALRAWAAAAARVPEAGWDLLEHFRSRLHAEIGRHLPERRHVALLIRWVNERQGTPHRRHQSYLEIEDQEVERLRCEQVASDRALPVPRRLLARVARMLLDQLQATRPDAEGLRFLKLRWQLKRAELELVGSPEEALERLASFRASAVDALAERAVGALLAEGLVEGEQCEELLRVWHPEREERRDVGSGITPSELLRGQESLWKRALAVAAAVFATGLAFGFVSFRMAPASDLTTGMREVFLAQREPSRADVLPKTSQLIRTIGPAETAQKPALLRVPAGEFLMGSPGTEDGRFRD